jgi:hypothetical protein
MKITLFLMFVLSSWSPATADDTRALKRAKYLLNGSFPKDDELSAVNSDGSYKLAIRNYVDSVQFYDAVLRYHERLFGTGLQPDYLDETLKEGIDFSGTKLAKVACGRENGRLICDWASSEDSTRIASCPSTWQVATTTFWYPGLVAWVCPSVQRSCGNNLSHCIVSEEDTTLAMNAELGTTEAFDAKSSVVKSLSRQSAGIAAGIVLGNYPYTKILEPGLTAVDGAVSYLYQQSHHFDLGKLNVSNSVAEYSKQVPLNSRRFTLIHTGPSYEQGGVISTFGWLRRFEKNRTRGNQLYERLLCRKFTSELPRVFPQDPGNLRTAAGCSGCHATLDPLADFFNVWGEGGELYTGAKSTTVSTFAGQTGSSVADLADIVRYDDAFATCTVEHVWEWLMGRGFYDDEASLRAALSSYFFKVNYSFKELVYAVATHPAFRDTRRQDALVATPLTPPPLGQPPGSSTQLPDCSTYGAISFATHIQPFVSACSNCHTSGGQRQPLVTLADWANLKTLSVSMMSSGAMPPGLSGPPFSGNIWQLKELVRCWNGVSP